MASYVHQLELAAQHLSAHDPVLAPTIQAAGLAAIRPHNEPFRELVIAIISQQVSSKAADTIFRRLEASFGGTLPGAEEIARVPVEDLRVVGISGRKSNYILDLASRASSGELPLRTLHQLSDKEVIEKLTAVKGIGEWTAHVFMIFCLGRLGILAVGDLGIRAGTRKLYGFDAMPTAEQVTQIAQERGWAPYRSIACWYVWRSLDSNLYLYNERP